MDFARFEFQMAKPGPDGLPLREKLKTLRTPQSFSDEPQCPPPLEHVWEWFHSLNAGRSGSGFGMNPISYSEISAWSSLTGFAPNAWEVGLLKDLDALYLKEMAPHD